MRTGKGHPLKIGKVLVAIVASVVLTLGALCLIACFASIPHPPTDEQMMDYYVQHKAEFGLLEDKLSAVTTTMAVFPDSAQCQIDQQMIETKDNEQCAEFVALFRSLDLEWAYVGHVPLYLPVYNWGLTVSALRKGYFYATHPSQLWDGEIVKTTQGPCRYPCFRQIDDNWYIYLDD